MINSKIYIYRGINYYLKRKIYNHKEEFFVVVVG